MNERFIKFLDATGSKSLVRILGALGRGKHRPAPALRDLNRFAVIRPGGMGDAALLLALLRILRNLKKEITLVANRRNGELCMLFEKLGLVDELLFLENLFSISRSHRGKIDCVIDTEQSFYTSALLAHALKPKFSVGFDTNERRELYDEVVVYRQEEYEAQSFLNLLIPLGPRPVLATEDLRLPSLEIDSNRLEISRGALVVACHAHVPERAIPSEAVNKILLSTKQHFQHIIAVGAKSALQYSDECGSGVNNFHNLCGETTIPETIAILQHAGAFLGADSGPMHLALLAGTPSIVGIFGPGIVKKWALPNIITPVYSNLPCQPCGYGRFSQIPPCPFNVRCLSNLPTEAVVRALT